MSSGTGLCAVAYLDRTFERTLNPSLERRECVAPKLRCRIVGGRGDGRSRGVLSVFGGYNQSVTRAEHVGHVVVGFKVTNAHAIHPGDLPQRVAASDLVILHGA